MEHPPNTSQVEHLLPLRDMLVLVFQALLSVEVLQAITHQVHQVPVLPTFHSPLCTTQQVPIKDLFQELEVRLFPDRPILEEARLIQAHLTALLVTLISPPTSIHPLEMTLMMLPTVVTRSDDVLIVPKSLYVSATDVKVN